MKNYTEFKVSTEPFNPELVSGLIWQLDIDGISETDENLVVFADSSKNITSEMIAEILRELVSNGMISTFSISEESFEDKNWNEEYEKRINVIEITDRVVIKPSFKEYQRKPGQIIITIDPKMSFGTGEHATTKLVITLIEEFVKKGDKVLDVGSGTGVLGICAVMLGASSALGIDNDEWCLLNGTENVKANGLDREIEIRLGELKDVTETSFDLIVANINRHILLDLAGGIKKKLSPGGRLILSGLLQTDREDILQRYISNGLRLIKSLEMDEWCALVLSI